MMFADRGTIQSGNSMTYASISRFALNGLSDLIRVLMENIDDALFDLSEKAESDHERSLYFEAMREIRIKRSLLQLGFDQAIDENFEELTKPQSPNTVAQLDAEELSLVEMEDIEDNIAIANMISKARPGFEDELFAVLERLKVVLRRKDIDEDSNPFDPKAICNSFHKASEILETDIQIKLIFYKLFDKYVVSNLGHFYCEMNEFFIQKGVLPQFKVSDERLKQTTKFMANRIKKASHQSTESRPNEVLQSADGDPTADDGLLSALQQIISTGTVEQDPSFTSTANSGPISNDGRGADISILPVAQNTSYMSALTNLQTQESQKQPILSVNPESFRQEMHQRLVAFNQQNSHQTNTADSQIIEIVSMLFDFFLDDATLPDPIKVLIGRLQIPILKTAIIDNNFFNHKKHPARQLLDCISKASLGWGEDSTREVQLTEKMESVVNYVLDEFDQDISVFSNALEDLNQYIEEEIKNSEIANEAVIQHEQDKDREISKAQQAATALVSKICKNRDLSFEVSDFLETTWISVLFHTHLSLGEYSNHWKNLRRTTSTLVWTLLPKFSEEERIKILRTLPALLRALSKGMELVKIGADTQNRIFRMLAKEHAKVVKQTSKNIVTRVDDETIWPEDRNIADAFAGINARAKKPEVIKVEEESAEDIDPDSISSITDSPTQDIILNLDEFTTSVNEGNVQIDEEIVLESVDCTILHASDSEQDDEFVELAQSLEIGSWVEFLEPDSQAVNTRLSWKSNITGKMVFVNRQGAKVRNLSVNAFAIELRSERAKFIESSSVFDRAVNTIVTSLRH